MSLVCECGRPAVMPISSRNTHGRKVNQYIKRKGHFQCSRCWASAIQQQMAARMAEVRSELQQGEMIR